ncbi:hypothetical protein AXZ77_2485 [Thioclava sp. ES.031]|uniref:hypothetical protein n=1 Tax=Thioclava sp. ES.031 TaxID=1798203 RepID=UPI000C00DEE0|nr:hypothetical protein [Thioclava sp. ES.031]PFG63864.1 hypothetical protein AXZ77_2485 [Thioclava sp. ES.031]
MCFRNAVGFFEKGHSYLQTADFVARGVEAGNLKLNFDDPVDFLYAHSLELMLKGCLLLDDPAANPNEYGHDTLRLFDEVLSRKFGGKILGAACENLRNNWKSHLRKARDIYALKFDVDETALSELGIASNAEIGEALPSLRKQVSWIAERNRASGGKFRYPVNENYRRQIVDAFGIRMDVVRSSISWGCADIYHGFRRLCSEGDHE